MIQAFVVVVVQVGLIALLAWLINHTLMRNRSAASRHLLWLAAMLAMGLTVPTLWVFPSIPLSIPASAVSEVHSDARHFPEMETEFLAQDGFEFEHEDWMVGSASGLTAPHVAVNSPTVDLVDPEMVPGNSARRFGVIHFVFAVYFSGFFFMLSRMVVAAVRLRRAASSAEKLNVPQDKLVRKLWGEFSHRNPPDVRVTSRFDIPLVFGLFRPCVLLPEKISSWPEERQRSVMLHELAHVSRHDAISDCLSQCVTAVFWFHPLVHWSLHCLRREREAATDECVVGSGIAALDYARHLVSVLEEVQVSRFTLGGIAMSRYGDMETRVKRILALDTSGKRSSRCLCLLIIGCFLSLGAINVHFAIAQEGPLGSGESNTIDSDRTEANVEGESAKTESPSVPAPAGHRDGSDLNPRAASDESKDTDWKGKTIFERLQNAPLVTDHDPVTRLTVEGVVVSADGAPVANAVVVLRQSNALSGNRTSKVNDLIARTKTNSEGRFRFSDVPNRRDFLPHQPFWEIVAGTPEQLGWKPIGESPVAHSLRIEIFETGIIKGTYRDPSGNPLADARVTVTSLSEPRPDDYSNESLTRMFLYSSMLRPETMTDANGEFVISGLPRDHLASVWIAHENWAHHFATVRTSDSVALGPRFPDRAPSLINTEIVESGRVFHAQTGFPIRGTVRDSQGNPVANCSVRMGAYVMTAKTDEAGRYFFRLEPDAFNRFGKMDDEIKCSIHAPVETGLLSQQAIVTKSQVTGGNDLNFVLEKGFEINGKVLSRDGKPLNDVYVRAVPSEFLSVTDPNQKVRTASAITRSDGSYRMLVSKTGDYHLLAWGKRPEYSLPSHVPTYRNFPTWGPQQTIQVKADVPTTAGPIVVSSAASVSVRCLDESGLPVKGARVQLLHRLPPVGGAWTKDEELSEFGVTDEKGFTTLKVSRLIASDVVLKAIVDEPGRHLWAEVSLPSDLTSQTHVITMRKMWRISGRATLGDGPMPGVGVMAWRHPPNRSRVGYHSMGGVQKLVDENGSYEWFVPPNGSYSVTLWSVKGLRNNPSARVNVSQVAPGEFRAEDFRFVMAHGTISGRVTDSNGRPLAGVQIASHPKFTDGNRLLLANPSPNTRRATSDDDGLFRIDGLPDGEYQLSAYVNPKTHYSSTAHVRAGDRDVVMKMVRRLKGRDVTVAR